MWRSSIALCLSLAFVCSSAVPEAAHATEAYVSSLNGEYHLSSPANGGRPPTVLPVIEGKAILERLSDPAHMVMTGLVDGGDATLRVGDSTKAELFAILGSASRLPDKRKSYFAYGYASSRRADSTVVVVDMGVPDFEPPDHVTGFLVCFGPSVLPKEYRPSLKNFSPSPGVSTRLSTQSGLRLGMTRAEVEEVFGKPLWKEKGAYYYGAIRDTLLTAEFLCARWGWPKNVESKPGTVDQFIKVWFVGARVSAFHIRKLYDM